MVRMTDLVDSARAKLEALPCPRFQATPRVAGPPLSERTVTLISTAGLMRRGEPTVGRGASGYRTIPHDEPADNILISHVSASFDRSGFQQDPNVMLPRQRLAELAAAGIIGGVAATHYAFMGAAEPEAMEPAAVELAATLRRNGVDSAVLLPV